MPSGEITLSGLSPDWLPAVAALHAQSLSYSINSRLGLGHLTRLYAAMLQEPECCVTTARRGEEVVGVVSVALNPNQFIRKFMSRLGPGQWLELAGRLALRPTLLLLWRESQDLSRPLHFDGQFVQPCLSAIAVAETSRRSGVGQALVARVDDWVRTHHYPAYYLDTLAENETARAFYRRAGFIEIEQRGKSIMLVKGV